MTYFNLISRSVYLIKQLLIIVLFMQTNKQAVYRSPYCMYSHAYVTLSHINFYLQNNQHCPSRIFGPVPLIMHLSFMPQALNVYTEYKTTPIHTQFCRIAALILQKSLKVNH